MGSVIKDRGEQGMGSVEVMVVPPEGCHYDSHRSGDQHRRGGLV